MMINDDKGNISNKNIQKLLGISRLKPPVTNQGTLPKQDLASDGGDYLSARPETA